MAKQRQYSGDETTETLANWKKDQKAAERLAGCVLHLDSFSEVDPAHPLGGRDGTKDIMCKKNGKQFIVAAYFPRTPQSFSNILKKFRQDGTGILKNNVDGLVFFTNQRLTLGERTKLKNTYKEVEVEIYHLERISSILNSPMGYGVRLEFLDIELNKTEQLSYFAHKDQEFKLIYNNLNDLLNILNQTESLPSISTSKLNEFKETLGIIVGDKNSLHIYGNSMIDKLHIPLQDLKEFQEVLRHLIGYSSYEISPVQRLNVPLKELEEFKIILYELLGKDSFMISPINKLSVPLKELEQYNEKLDEILKKLKEIEIFKKYTI